MSGWAQPGRVARPGTGRWQHGDAYVHDRGWQGGLAGAGATLSPQAAHPRPRPSRACTAVLPTQSRAGPVRAASGGAGSAADPRSPPLVAAPPPRLRLRPAVTGPSTCHPRRESAAQGSERPAEPSPPVPGRRPRDTKERWSRGRRRSQGAARRQSACSKFAQLGRLKPEPGAGEGRPGPAGDQRRAGLGAAPCRSRGPVSTLALTESVLSFCQWSTCSTAVL